MEDLALTIGGKTIQTPEGIPTGGLFPTGENILETGVNLLFLISFVLAILFIILSGIQWILSTGDKQKVQAARGRLTFAIVGLLVILLAYFIVQLVGTFFDVQLLAP